MAIDPNVGPNTGWNLSPLGTSSVSTAPGPLTPQQVQQIQQTTAAMSQPSQQSSMMAGLFGPQSNLGQNLGSMAQGFMGGPAYGGGNIFTDAYGGSASNPLPGLTKDDYGM